MVAVTRDPNMEEEKQEVKYALGELADISENAARNKKTSKMMMKRLIVVALLIVGSDFESLSNSRSSTDSNTK